MSDTWLDKWEDRYRKVTYAYGTEPNQYFAQELSKLKPGTILLAAEGEGRNAVFAAQAGWDVSAFDISTEGRKKALLLATQTGVTLKYQVGELPDLLYQGGQFDACALIYAHFPAKIRSYYHRLLDSYIRLGGMLILEGFGENHLQYRQENKKMGGPNELADLITVEDIQSDFSNYEVIELVEKVVDLNEGLYHKGRGSVTRFVGRKTNNPPKV